MAARALKKAPTTPELWGNTSFKLSMVSVSLPVTAAAVVVVLVVVVVVVVVVVAPPPPPPPRTATVGLPDTPLFRCAAKLASREVVAAAATAAAVVSGSGVVARSLCPSGPRGKERPATERVIDGGNSELKAGAASEVSILLPAGVSRWNERSLLSGLLWVGEDGGCCCCRCLSGRWRGCGWDGLGVCAEDCSWCGGSGRAVEAGRGDDDGCCCLGVVDCEEEGVGSDCMFILGVAAEGAVAVVEERLNAVGVPVPVMEIVKVGGLWSSMSAMAVVVVMVVVVVLLVVVVLVVPMSVLLFVAGRTVESRVSKAGAVDAASGRRSGAASLFWWWSGGGVVVAAVIAAVTALLGLASAGRRCSPLGWSWWWWWWWWWWCGWWWFRGSSW